MRKQLSIRFTEKLKEHINESNKASRLNKPIAGIMLASMEGREDWLTIGVFDRDASPAGDEFPIFESDGIEFVVPQEQIHSDLEGRVLDIRDGKIFIAD